LKLAAGLSIGEELLARSSIHRNRVLVNGLLEWIIAVFFSNLRMLPGKAVAEMI
jgi:hypothetical protein